MIWHRGRIRQLDIDKRAGRMRRVGGCWGDGDVHFRFGPEIADDLLRAVRDGLQIDFWLTGDRGMIYNLVIDGKSTRAELDALAVAWGLTDQIPLALSSDPNTSTPKETE